MLRALKPKNTRHVRIWSAFSFLKLFNASIKNKGRYLAYDKSVRVKAKKLFEQGLPLSEIEKELAVKERTLRGWLKDTPQLDIKTQIAKLSKSKPTEAIARTLSMLTKSLTRIEAHDKKTKKEKPKQLVVLNANTAELKRKMFEPEYGLYPYQVKFAQDESRFRVWLKSRQIGATYGCSGECLAEAMGGLDQLIISASEEQALKWKSEIEKHAGKLGILLGGSESKITTPAGTTIYIFANNFRTIQGFSGSVWLDEFAWYTNCKRIWEAFLPSITSVKAGEMKARVTILSTPFEQGSLFHKLINDATKFYMFSRHTTSIHDAVGDGLDVDVGILKDLFDADSWAMMYECIFVDDESALLPVSLIRSCVNDKLRLSADKNEALRAGYDIGRKIDLSVLIAFAQRVVNEKAKFVMTHLETYRKAPFDAQKVAISAFMDYFGDSILRIDATGIGTNLAEDMRNKYRKRAVEIMFTQAVKEQMALNIKKAFEDGILEIPNDPLLIADLHAIKRKAGARGFIYDADRNEHGHADRFWACALALFGEDFILSKKPFDTRAVKEAMEKMREKIQKQKEVIL
jgi:phage FluMu gp28-like protein